MGGFSLAPGAYQCTDCDASCFGQDPSDGAPPYAFCDAKKGCTRCTRDTLPDPTTGLCASASLFPFRLLLP